MFYEISAKNNKGIKELLDGILLFSEIKELKTNENKKAVGSVIESELDKHEVPKATLLVQNGTLRVGDYLACGNNYCKVRKMTIESNKSLTTALPSNPVSVIGFSGVPQAGDKFMVFDTEAEAKKSAEFKNNTVEQKVSLSGIASQDGDQVILNLVLKTDTSGSTEAIKNTLNKINVEGSTLNIIQVFSGDVSQADVILAAVGRAVIITFNVRVTNQIKDIAKEEKVEIKYYDIIYKLLEDIELDLKGKLAPKLVEVTHGQLEVRSLFKASKVGQIAGCYVTSGKIKSSDKLRVFRNEEMIKETKISSLKRFKNKVKEVSETFECGLTIDDNFVLVEGDILEAYDLEEEK